MDVVRARPRRLSSGAFKAIGVAALVGAAGWSTYALLRPQAAQPAVDRSTLITDIAVRGALVRSLRAQGTLVAERVRLAASPADGTIDTIPGRVGSIVSADSVIATMRNPELDAGVIDAQAMLDAARAELASVREEASAAVLDQRAALRSAEAQLKQNDEESRADAALDAKGLIPAITARVARIKADAARDAVSIDRRKIVVAAADGTAKIAAAQAKVSQLGAALGAKRAQLATLVVRAGASGVVQSLAVERGARVTAGTQLARIVDQRDLKATLQVPQADIRDVVPGLPATVDTGTGLAAGHVARVDPAAQNGAIAVDVAFDRALPRGVRPDLLVTGTIEFSRIADAISIARPVNAADRSTLDVYVLADRGTRAVRRSVRLGVGSADRVQVLSGVAPGETVIVSDTTAEAGAPSLRIR